MAYTVHNPVSGAVFGRLGANTVSNMASMNDNVMYDTTTTPTNGVYDTTNTIGNKATISVLTFESTYLTPEQSIHLQSIRNIPPPQSSPPIFFILIPTQLNIRHCIGLLFKMNDTWSYPLFLKNTKTDLEFLSRLDECEWNGNNDEEYV
eukprot:15366795-Ditylum_brightwellii.AAC.1